MSVNETKNSQRHWTVVEHVGWKDAVRVDHIEKKKPLVE